MEKKSMKQKTKDLIKDNKVTVIYAGGLMVLIGLSAVYSAGHKTGYMRGFKSGAVVSFQETMNWFDRIDPNLNLAGVWDAYKKANPEKIVAVTL